MTTISLFIVSHKNYSFPNLPFYTPIQVGKKATGIDLNILSDDTEDNISIKNNSFCELTAIYWLWKNNIFNQTDYIGLVHYRRFFKGSFLHCNKGIATEGELANILAEYDCILPKKRNYWIESVYSHYKNAHFIQDLEITKSIIQQIHPEYIPAFDQIMQGKQLHLYNMFVMKKELFNDYCYWLFSILFQLEKHIDITHYDTYQQRVFGFIAERLFNVWIKYNNIYSKELEVVNVEGDNYFKKIIGFLARKFLRW